MSHLADYLSEIRDLVEKYCIKDTVNHPKVSIIVPAYNSADYITDCLLSLLQQTLKEIEIIIVNDGSTDSTTEIISIFEKADSRVKIITQENQGLGAARNHGIELANGEFIGFVDSDDYVDTDYFEKLYNTAKINNAGISVASVLKHKKHYKKYHVLYKKEKTADNIQDKMELCGDKTKRFFYAWNKIYKTNLIKDNDIKFSEGQVYEDVIFAIKTLNLSNKVVSVPYINYHYIEHKNSLVKSKNNQDKKKNDYIKAYTQLQQYCKDKNIILPERLNYYMNIWYNPFVKTYIGQYKAKDMLFGIIPIKTRDINYDFPVDLVYLWVDGNDPEWKKKKEYWQEQYGMKIDNQAIDNSRFVDNGELKYSLRSVEKYASWINKIYIVTDNQIPKWLNTDSPKIEVVFHEKFIPKENLPLFNSSALEFFIHNIPNLNEHFLYANDDMFFGKYVNKQFFFDINDKPIIRLKHQVSKRYINSSIYTYMILNMQKLIKTKYGKFFPYAPHHNIDAYVKRHYSQCVNEFTEDIRSTLSNKFRSKSDFQRSIVSYYMLAKNEARLKKYARIDKWKSPLHRFKCFIKKKYCADSIMVDYSDINPDNKLNMYNPKLFCINDDEKTLAENKEVMKLFLKNHYMQKSSYEKTEELCQK